MVTAPDGTHRGITRRVGPNGEKWTTERDAKKALREALTAVDKGEWTDPSKQLLGAYLDEWLAGLRLAPSTIASYRKNVRLHIKPYIGTVPLATMAVTGTGRINAMYRELERTGRRDHKGERIGQPLGARTVRYIHTILSAALAEAVAEHRLGVNPAAAAKPPSAKQRRRRRCRHGRRRSCPRSWPGRRRTATRTLLHGTPSRTRVCGGGKRWRCGGVTWTWTRAPSVCAGRPG